MKNRMGIGSPERNETDTYERGMKIVPECIAATENEIPVKQYNIAILRNLLRFERAEGRLQVTNKRVIFRAAGTSVRGRTSLQQEYAIDEVAGIEARNNYKFNFLYLLFALAIMYLAYSIIFQSGMTRQIMNPRHVQLSRERERDAIQYRNAAERAVPVAEAKLRPAQEAVTNAERDARDGIQRTRRIERGRDWMGNMLYDTQRYRDTSESAMAEAQANLATAIREKEYVEREIEQAKANLENALLAETEAVRRRDRTEKTWATLMTLFGLAIGIGCLIPFFAMYKKFGLKLFFLCFSIAGFQLSHVASRAEIFYLFLGISVITTIVCVFIFCFRPNLVINILNKMGSTAAIDIRRENQVSMAFEKGLGFMEVIPTEESESAIRELGAIINDIQKLGDLGLAKWVVK